jgi:CheY-like chemotaxis protein
MTLTSLAHPAPYSRLTADAAPSLSGLAILVLDDEAIIELWLTETLREMGATVHSASTGADALALIDDHPEIQLLLADVQLPDMNGAVLAGEAKKRLPNLRVIYLTGLSSAETPLDAPILQKPFGSPELMAALAELLSTDDLVQRLPPADFHD